MALVDVVGQETVCQGIFDAMGVLEAQDHADLALGLGLLQLRDGTYHHQPGSRVIRHIIDAADVMGKGQHTLILAGGGEEKGGQRGILDLLGHAGEIFFRKGASVDHIHIRQHDGF